MLEGCASDAASEGLCWEAVQAMPLLRGCAKCCAREGRERCGRKVCARWRRINAKERCVGERSAMSCKLKFRDLLFGFYSSIKYIINKSNQTDRFFSSVRFKTKPNKNQLVR